LLPVGNRYNESSQTWLTFNNPNSSKLGSLKIIYYFNPTFECVVTKPLTNVTGRVVDWHSSIVVVACRTNELLRSTYISVVQHVFLVLSNQMTHDINTYNPIFIKSNQLVLYTRTGLATRLLNYYVKVFLSSILQVLKTYDHRSK